jgi:hypothetical protein
MVTIDWLNRIPHYRFIVAFSIINIDYIKDIIMMSLPRILDFNSKHNSSHFSFRVDYCDLQCYSRFLQC